MSVLVHIFKLAGQIIVCIFGIAEPDMKDPFWEEYDVYKILEYA
jgi:hypothetical protein